MKLKSLFLLVAFILSADILANEQKLWLYSINGNVDVLIKGQWVMANSYQDLSLVDSIRFTEGSSITILDHLNDRLLAIQMTGNHSIKSIITAAQTKTKRQPKNVVTYLWECLRGNNSADEHRKSAGVVYRNDDINTSIASAISTMSTNLPVEFILLDTESGYPIGESATVGKSAIVKVKNHSPFDLFVNILDVDTNGNSTVCFPVSSVQQMTQLLIPSESEVVLDSFPIVFSEPKGEDNLILVASPDWFDIDSVIINVRNRKTTTGKVNVGIYKQRLIVK